VGVRLAQNKKKTCSLLVARKRNRSPGAKSGKKDRWSKRAGTCPKKQKHQRSGGGKPEPDLLKRGGRTLVGGPKELRALEKRVTQVALIWGAMKGTGGGC